MYTAEEKKKIILKIVDIYSQNISFDNLIKKSLESQGKKNINVKRAKAYLSIYNLNDIILNLNNIIFDGLKKNSKMIIKNKGVTEKIFSLVIKRIELSSKYKTFNLIVIRHLIKPENILFSKKLLFSICDQIWFLSGDKSVDFNYYSKRIILMKIYFSTFNFSLKDKSTNLNNTEDYLRNQLSYVSKIGKIKYKFKQIFNI